MSVNINKLMYHFVRNDAWHQMIREKYLDEEANKSFKYDGRYRDYFGRYLKKETYVFSYLECELDKNLMDPVVIKGRTYKNDIAAYVYHWTNNPELATAYLTFKTGIPKIRKTMLGQSKAANCRYMENLLIKGDKGNNKRWLKAARQ